MPALERRLGPRGPRFWYEGGELMFCHQFDGSTRDGPRKATDADKIAHPDALARADALEDGIGAPLTQFKTPAKRRG